MTGIEAIAQERDEQLTKHGRTIEKDLALNSGEDCPLTKAAAMLTTTPMTEMVINYGRPKGWDYDWWLNVCAKPYKERLAIAGALIAAEYDRISCAKPVEQV